MKPKIIGALSPGYWESLTEEERQISFVRDDPAGAYKRILQLEASNEAYRALLNSTLSTAAAIFGGKAKAKLEAKRRKLANLNQTEATAENQRKSVQFKHDLKKYVEGRIGRDPATAPKAIVQDVLLTDWVRKKKNGKPYAASYLYPIVSKLVSTAKAARRRG